MIYNNIHDDTRFITKFTVTVTEPAKIGVSHYSWEVWGRRERTVINDKQNKGEIMNVGYNKSVCIMKSDNKV